MSTGRFLLLPRVSAGGLFASVSLAAVLAPTPARAACTVALRQPPANATLTQTPTFTWTATGDCVSYRVYFSPQAAFPAADRTVTAWQTTRNFTFPEDDWDAAQAGAWAAGVWWKVQHEDTAGVRAFSARRHVTMDPDLDDDGSSQAAGDCDDLDALVHPGAEETCDDVDQDCDGMVDEEAVDATPWFADSDADGFGDAGDWVLACAPPEGWVGDDDDCDDGDITMNPGESEWCDSVDNDCNLLVDDGIDCTSCDPTAVGLRGPNYLEGMPYSDDLRDPDLAGTNLVLYGKVVNDACEPLSGAVLDVWQGGPDGYDFDAPLYYRGLVATDDRGTWQFVTHMPEHEVAGNGEFIPLHVHYITYSPGYRRLTTEMFFAGDGALDGTEDPSLVATPVPDGDGGYRMRWQMALELL